MANYWKLVNDVLMEADVLLLILDARFIQETRHMEIEDKVKRMKKPLIYVISKSDLVDKKQLEIYKKNLANSVFVSAKEHHGTKILRDAIILEVKKIGLKNAVVGVLGYPNVGKSSIINALKGKKSASTSIESGHTKNIQKINIDNRLMLLDTPGVIPYNEKSFLKHNMIGTIDFNKSKEPDVVAMEILIRFPGKVESFYGVKTDEDKEQTITNIAMKRHMLVKGGHPDFMRTARMILKDWQAGNIK